MEQIKAGGGGGEEGLLRMLGISAAGLPRMPAWWLMGFEVLVLRTEGWPEQGPRRRGLPSPWY